MTCCPAIIQTFGGVSSTFVSYTGPTPRVESWYFLDGVLKQQNPVITVSPLGVTVDHGGISTGILKLITE